MLNSPFQQSNGCDKSTISRSHAYTKIKLLLSEIICLGAVLKLQIIVLISIILLYICASHNYQFNCKPISRGPEAISRTNLQSKLIQGIHQGGHMLQALQILQSIINLAKSCSDIGNYPHQYVHYKCLNTENKICRFDNCAYSKIS